MLYAMAQEGCYKATVWGGRKLETLLGKRLPAGETIGESWEVADHPHGESHVAEGLLAGRGLRWVVENAAEELYGPGAPAAWRKRFPLMVKIIDAAEDLSVQVHPDDAYVAAQGVGDSGKTECWVVLEAAPGAELINGVKRGVGREEFRAAVERGTVAELLERQPVRAGDVVFIPAGRVHAIGRGIVLAEFQQPSDVTYRVFDWNRKDASGRGRELHLERALECIRFDWPGSDLSAKVRRGEFAVESLTECPQFWLQRVTVGRGEAMFNTLGLRGGEGFQCMMAVAGQGSLTAPRLSKDEVELRPGRTVIVPAAVEEYRLETDAGLTVLVSGVEKK
jgi:mannose-6-phosphate isomerase